MCVLRKDVWVGNPSHSGLHFKKFPSDLVHDEVKKLKPDLKIEQKVNIDSLLRNVCVV